MPHRASKTPLNGVMRLCVHCAPMNCPCACHMDKDEPAPTSAERECGPGMKRCTGGYDGLDEPVPCPNHDSLLYPPTSAERCPTCGSDNPERAHKPCWDRFKKQGLDFDKFHSTPPGAGK